MPDGPQLMKSNDRLALARELAQRVHRHYGERALAVGIYGSVARGQDGPYSDIEIHCVLHGCGIDLSHEWSTGPWKAQIDVYSEDVLLRWAAEVDERWPLTHRACTNVMAVYDPTGFFPRLRETALTQPDEAFQQAIRDVIVGELYELIGKIRNARAGAHESGLPYLAVELCKYGACLLGLGSRYLYSGAPRFLEESLALPGRPTGYDRLCRLVMAGDLGNAGRVVDACDGFWTGIERWAQEREIAIEDDLESVLVRESAAPARRES